MCSLVISRLAPGEGQIQVDWLLADAGDYPKTAELTLECSPKDTPGAPARIMRLPLKSSSATIDELRDGCDYEVRLRVRCSASDEVLAQSATRLARPGHVPGTVVNYIHPEDYTYNSSGRSTASPSLAILPNGRYVASHDIFWGRHGQNLSMVFFSDDQGESWRFAAELYPCFWGKLFVHRQQLYMLSTETEYGALIIRKCLDGGESWSPPTRILPGGDHERGGPHKAPVPVVEHKGRLWSAVEHGSWQIGAHDAGVVSAPVDADLLDPASWSVAPFLAYDPKWPGTVVGGDRPGVLEGNVVVTPSGGLVNVLRYNTVGGIPDYGKAIMLDINDEDPTAPLRFARVIDFPGNMSKFAIRFDPVTQCYWSLVNRVSTPNVRQRNILTLTGSNNLVDWEIVTDILDYEHNEWPEDASKVGFQYVDWQFDGEDIILLSRTAINGAWNYHNANYITFHRLADFRRLAFNA